MVCCLFLAKALSAYWPTDPRERSSMKFEWKSDRLYWTTMHFKNAICEISAMLFRRQWVNKCTVNGNFIIPPPPPPSRARNLSRHYHHHHQWYYHQNSSHSRYDIENIVVTEANWLRAWLRCWRRPPYIVHDGRPICIGNGTKLSLVQRMPGQSVFGYQLPNRIMATISIFVYSIVLCTVLCNCVRKFHFQMCIHGNMIWMICFVQLYLWPTKLLHPNA